MTLQVAVRALLSRSLEMRLKTQPCCNPMGNNFGNAGSISRELDLIGVEHGSIKLSITYDKLN